MLLKEGTKKIQSQLSNYCKTGNLTPIEGAKGERLPTYRRLVFNVIRDTLRQAYPITFEVLNSEDWNNLVYDFFSNHSCQNNEVWKMPFELVQYVEETGYHIKLNKPYLLEMLYFEWLEIEIHGQEDVEIPILSSINGTLSDNIFLNPYCKIIQLEYPVHKFGHKELEDNKGIYFVCIYRSISTDKVHFLELSNFSAHLLSLLSSDELKISEAIEQIATNAKMSKSALRTSATNFISKMEEKEVVLGRK